MLFVANMPHSVLSTGKGMSLHTAPLCLGSAYNCGETKHRERRF